MSLLQISQTHLGVIGLILIAMTPLAGATGLPPEAKAIVEHYNMEKIPHEGPWFVQTAKSDDLIEGSLAKRYQGKRMAYTAIVSLMTKSDFSAIHRLKTDEVWHFYKGAPAKVLMLHPDGSTETLVLGNDFSAGQVPQITVPRGSWMGAVPMGDTNAFTLFGATMAPGFEYQDYQAGDSETLIGEYPEQAKLIKRLTRHDEAVTSETVSNPNSPVAIEEIVGLHGPQISEETSVAKVTMQAGATFPLSYNKIGTEVIIVASGNGTLILEGQPHMLRPNAVVLLPAGKKYSISATSDLIFHAVVSPAFTPDDHVELSE